MEIVEVTKIHKYRALREKLRRRYSGYQVRQLNFIIGIPPSQGTIVEHSLSNLTTMGIEKGRQDKTIRQCMTASIYRGDAESVKGSRNRKRRAGGVRTRG